MELIKTKSHAVAIFGTQADTARALGITPQAIGVWPENLNQRQADELTGAALRLGLLDQARRQPAA